MWTKRCFLGFVLILFLSSNASAFFGRDDDYDTTEKTDTKFIEKDDQDCVEPLLYGVDWVVHNRHQDYGWGEDTHRAIVILELNNYGKFSGNKEEINLMRHHLEVELTGAMLRNGGNIPSPTDLALYVQALLAIGRDPRDFYGLNLVEELLSIVNSQQNPHPFLVLVLCSCRAVSDDHLVKIRNHIHGIEQKTGQQRELAAIALKAFACAMKDGRSMWKDLGKEMSDAAKALVSLQKPDGSFGNLYTTALIFQALKVYNGKRWNEEKALNFLKEEQNSRVNNILMNYYIEMAKHAENGLFFTSESVAPYTSEGFYTVDFLKTMKKEYFVHYTLKVGDSPDTYHSMAIKVPANVSFFDIMRVAAAEDPKFNFSYTVVHKNGQPKKPIVYKISDIPNDAENGLYWRLVHETDINHNRHESRMKEQNSSPIDVQPMDGTHYIYWFCDIFRELNGVTVGSQYRSFTYTGIS